MEKDQQNDQEKQGNRKDQNSNTKTKKIIEGNRNIDGNNNIDGSSELNIKSKLYELLKSIKIRKLTIRLWVYFIAFLIYLEVVFHLILYRNIDTKIIYPILFAIPTCTVLTFIINFFENIIRKILIWITSGMICLVFCIQLIYTYVFKVFFSFQSMGMAGDAFSEFGADIVSAICNNIGGLILLIIPIPVLGLFIKYITNEETANEASTNKMRFKDQYVVAVVIFITHLLALGSLHISGHEDYTPYDLYHNSQVLDLCGKQLGVITMTRFDFSNLMQGKEDILLTNTDSVQWEDDVTITEIPAPTANPENNTDIKTDVIVTTTPTPTPTPIPIDTSPNIMNIDFNALAQSEKDDTIKTMHEYFASVTPTNKNEYTGMFQGYNLIMITAEGFSPYAVHPEKTPTLYRLTKEGFVFNNFYTALWQTSTSDGEYVAMTGLIPVGTRSMYRSRNNAMPFALGHQFNSLGIPSKAFHNHTYTYYQRNETHPNLGYDFKAIGNGMVLESNTWPNSDLEMINATVDEYINEDTFHVYYLTVSGHMNYTFVGNSISYKNRDLVSDLPYSSDVQAYLACQMELDRALEQLINKLEEAGVADRTVIALSADHYPYGWEKENLDEIAGHVVDPNFEVYRNNFILWSEGMKENITIDKPCSSLDIIPTLSNLFGLEYDSRLLMGQDILSDASPLVILNNRSFITDKVMYNSQTREVVNLTDEELPENYIDTLNKIIKNKFTISENIIKRDYYRYILPETAK